MHARRSTAAHQFPKAPPESALRLERHQRNESPRIRRAILRYAVAAGTVVVEHDRLASVAVRITPLVVRNHAEKIAPSDLDNLVDVEHIAPLDHVRPNSIRRRAWARRPCPAPIARARDRRRGPRCAPAWSRQSPCRLARPRRGTLPRFRRGNRSSRSRTTASIRSPIRSSSRRKAPACPSSAPLAAGRGVRTACLGSAPVPAGNRPLATSTMS